MKSLQASSLKHTSILCKIHSPAANRPHWAQMLVVSFSMIIYIIRFPNLIMKTSLSGAPHSGLPVPIVMLSISKVIVRRVYP